MIIGSLPSISSKQALRDGAGVVVRDVEPPLQHCTTAEPCLWKRTPDPNG